jgi:hypothetical protein
MTVSIDMLASSGAMIQLRRDMRAHRVLTKHPCNVAPLDMV